MRLYAALSLSLACVAGMHAVSANAQDHTVTVVLNEDVDVLEP